MESKKYPIGGYAPGNYSCTCCKCGTKFSGDKRAVECEQCAVSAKEKFDALSPDEQAEVIKRNIEEVNKAFSDWTKKPDVNLAIVGHGKPALYYPGSYYQPLFDLMRHEHGTILTESALTDIIEVVEKMRGKQPGPRWVKASEGLIPDGIHSMKLVSSNDVIMRGTGLVNNNTITLITFLNKTTMGVNDLPKDYEGIYYLDEQPAAGREEDAGFRETIENIILSAGKHNQEQCSEIADAILRDLSIGLRYQKKKSLSVEREEDAWTDVNDRLPEEGGRYWCYVESLTDLGFSYFQWNCDYNPQLRRFSDMTLTKGERITHWRPLAKPPKKG